VDAATEAAHLDGMLEVEHLVVEQVLEGVAGAGGAVEDLADDDGVVGGVVVAEGALGVVLAPGEVGPAEQAAEETSVEIVEDFFEMEEAAVGAGDSLCAAGVADELGLTRDGGRGGKTFVAEAVCGVDGLLVELGEKDMGDGVEDGLRRALEQVGEADVDVGFAKADGGVERGEAAETDGDGRHGSARPKRAIFELKDGDKIEGHSVLQPLLEKKLGRPVSVYNFGQSSWFSTQERILFEQLILSGQKPDLAIFLDGLNDFHWINQVMPAIPIDRPSFPKTPTFRSVLKDAKTVLPMTRLAISVHNALEKSAHRKTSDELKVANTKFDDPVSLQNAVDRYFTNKRMIEAEAKEYGVKTLFVWEPAPFYKYDEKIDPFIDPEYGFSFTGFTYVKYGYPVMRDYVDRTHPDNFLWCADLQQDLHELLYVDPYHYSPKMTEIISGCIVDGVK
jgi:hypothetical protein